MTTAAVVRTPKTPPADEPAATRAAASDGRFASLVEEEAAAADRETGDAGPNRADRKRKVEPEAAAAAAVVVSALAAPTPAAPLANAASEAPSPDAATGGAQALPLPASPATTAAAPARDPVAAGVASLIAAAEQAAKKTGTTSTPAAGAGRTEDALEGVVSLTAQTQADDAPSSPTGTAALKAETAGPQQVQGPKIDAPAPLAAPTAGGASTATDGGTAAKVEAKADAKSPTDLKAAAKPGETNAAAETTDKVLPGVDPASAAARDAGASPDRSAAPGQPAQAPAPSATTSAQTQPTSALASAAAAQVATEIAGNAGSRKTRFEVRLDPGELGRVDVRLDIGHDGRVSTRLIVEKAETLDMLKQDARELTRQLEQAGFQLGQGGLAFQLKDGRQDLWRQYEPETRAATAAAEEIEEAAPAASLYARAPRSGASGVDRTV